MSSVRKRELTRVASKCLPTNASQRGMALLNVLWVMFGISAISLFILNAQQGIAVKVMNYGNLVRLQHTIDGATNLHLYNTFTHTTPVIGLFQEKIYNLYGSQVRIRTYLESGKFDVNKISTDTLTSVLSKMHIEHSSIDNSINRLKSFRKQDTQIETTKYCCQRYRKGTFGSLNQFLTELKIPNSAYQTILETFTLYASSDRPNINYATVDVLRLLPHIDDANVESVINFRTSNLISVMDALKQNGGTGEVIKIEASSSKKGLFLKRCVYIQTLLNTRQPFIVLDRNNCE